ncbi:MAG: molybdopterin-guanine dinucleotide biosynthesis protein B [Planctomycetes bacterium]|nr:molybdopterin-guanine dinucleotide biosynthesis protein B [Planctomycetota bacterium]
MLPAVISVVGKSNSGKTTFLEKLIGVLKARGYNVGVIKHDTHGFEMDHEGKDSYRLFHAGSASTMIVSDKKCALVKNLPQPLSLDETVNTFFYDVDIVITEGFKRENKQKIEVSRKENSTELLCSDDELIAFVSDYKIDRKAPVYGLNDAEGVAGLLEKKFLNERKAVESHDFLTLRADGKRVGVKDFVQDFIAGGINGMASALRGVENPEVLEIVIRKSGRKKT